MRLLACYTLVFCFSIFALRAQTLKATPPDGVKPGQVVVINIVGNVGDGDAISWSAKPQNGHFLTGKDPKRVEFTPDGPAESVVVICTIVDSRTHQKKEPFITIPLLATNPAPVSGATPPPHATPPHLPPVQPAAGYNTELELYGLTRLGFVPAGFMGAAEDGQSVELDPGSTESPFSKPTCIKLTYNPADPSTASEKGKVAWAAIAWQATDGEPNFGESPGKKLDSEAFRSLQFMARAPLTSRNRPVVVQFKSGGGTKPGLDASKVASYSVVEEFRPLPQDWTRFCISVPPDKLTNVVSALTVVLTRASNPTGAVVFLDDIHFSRQPCGQ